MSPVLCTPNHHGGVSSHPGNCGRCLEAQMEQPRVGSGASLSAGRRVAWGCPLPGGQAVGLQVPVPIVLGSARWALGCRQVGYVLAQPGLSPKPVPVGHCRGGSARHPPPMPMQAAFPCLCPCRPHQTPCHVWAGPSRARCATACWGPGTCWAGWDHTRQSLGGVVYKLQGVHGKAQQGHSSRPLGRQWAWA